METRRSKMSSPAAMWDLLKQTFAQWSKDKVPRLGAALAYYTVFSIVPLLVIIIAMIGLVFGQEAAQGYILQQLETLLGEQSAAAIKDMIQRANQPTTGILATVVALATLLFGASGLFGQLQDSLNSIWGVEPKERGIWGVIQDRFFSFMAVLGTGFLLLVSLVMSAGLAAFGKWFGGWLPAPEFILQILNAIFSLAVITVLFALMFKVLPDARIAWSDVWIGGALTALLFTIGKFAIGVYLGKSDVGSAYGAAGSLVILLVWVYYSAQILLFGAEFTQVYANKAGSRIVPDDKAVSVDPEKAVNDVPDKGTTTRQPDPRPRPQTGGNKDMWVPTTSRTQAGTNSAAEPPFKKEIGWLGMGLLILSMVKAFRRDPVGHPP
ncbi:MAG: putative rane protein [Nitrospira sp.]|nr:putative rane protein [Nitrospira sp.]